MKKSKEELKQEITLEQPLPEFWHEEAIVEDKQEREYLQRFCKSAISDHPDIEAYEILMSRLKNKALSTEALGHFANACYRYWQRLLPSAVAIAAARQTIEQCKTRWNSLAAGRLLYREVKDQKIVYYWASDPRPPRPIQRGVFYLCHPTFVLPPQAAVKFIQPLSDLNEPNDQNHLARQEQAESVIHRWDQQGCKELLILSNAIQEQLPLNQRLISDYCLTRLFYDRDHLETIFPPKSEHHSAFYYFSRLMGQESLQRWGQQPGSVSASFSQAVIRLRDHLEHRLLSQRNLWIQYRLFWPNPADAPTFSSWSAVSLNLSQDEKDDPYRISVREQLNQRCKFSAGMAHSTETISALTQQTLRLVCAWQDCNQGRLAQAQLSFYRRNLVKQIESLNEKAGNASTAEQRQWWNQLIKELEHSLADCETLEITLKKSSGTTHSSHIPTSDWESLDYILHTWRTDISHLWEIPGAVVRRNQQAARQLITHLCAETQRQLGAPPCAFMILGMGSYSRGEIGFTSDLDFAVLIADSQDVQSAYFKAFLDILVFKASSFPHSLPHELLPLEDNELWPMRQGECWIGTPKKMIEEYCYLPDSDKGKAMAFNRAWPMRWGQPLYCPDDDKAAQALWTDYQRHLQEFYQQTDASDVPYYRLIEPKSLDQHLKKDEAFSLAQKVASTRKEKEKRRVIAEKVDLKALMYRLNQAALSYGRAAGILDITDTQEILLELEKRIFIAPTFVRRLRQALNDLSHWRLRLQWVQLQLTEYPEDWSKNEVYLWLLKSEADQSLWQELPYGFYLNATETQRLQEIRLTVEEVITRSLTAYVNLATPAKPAAKIPTPPASPSVEIQPAERKQPLSASEVLGDVKEITSQPLSVVKTPSPPTLPSDEAQPAERKQELRDSEDQEEVKELKEGKEHDKISAQPLPADQSPEDIAPVFHPLAVVIESALIDIIALQTQQEMISDPTQLHVLFNKQAQQLVWLAKVMAHCAAEFPVLAVDPKFPRAVQENSLLHAHWRVYWRIPQARQQFYMRSLRAASSTSLENLLQFISEAPDAAGWRLSTKEFQQRWQDQLFQELTIALSPQAEIKNAMTIEWIDPLDGRRIRRCLRDRDAQALFDEQGRPRKPEKPSVEKRLVIPLYAEEKKSEEKNPTVLAYAKVYPEMPGVQAAVDTFSSLISGYGCLATLCRVTHPKQSQAYPVLISQNAGENLAKMSRQPDDSGFWSALDKTALTLKIIECLFINPEDYKFNNWAFSLTRLLNGKQRYRLTAFDNDHAFVEPLLSSALGGIKVNVKNGLYCLKAMQEPLDEEAVALFLSLDPINCLEEWLKRLMTITESSLFSSEQKEKEKKTEMDILLEAHNCFIPIALIPGTMAQLYEKWLRIRAALQDKDTSVNTPMELLERIEPLLAREYRKTFAPDNHNPEARFAILRTHYEENKDPVSQEIYRQSVFQARLSAPKSIAVIPESKAVDMRKAIREELLCTPHHMMKHEWPYIQSYYEKMALIHAELQQGELKSWRQLPLTPYEREEILRRLDFKAIDPEQQKPLLTSLVRLFKNQKNQIFQTLSLAYADQLTDNILTSLAKQITTLRVLDISYCPQITPTAIYEILRHCRELQVLRLVGLPKLIRLDASLFKYSSLIFSVELLGTRLQILDVRDCTKLQKILELYLPQLQTLITENCPALITVDIQAWRLQYFRSNNCPRLPNYQIYDMKISAKDKKMLEWFRSKAQKNDEDAQEMLNRLLSKNRYTLMCFKPEIKPVDRLLSLVAQGEQDLAEIIIKRNRGLLFMKGVVTDFSLRKFENITPFQYAFWALDWHMWRMILNYLPEDAAAQQCAELEAEGTAHGHHFSLQPLITALQTYLDQWENWNWTQRETHWCKVIGGEQRRLPVYMVNEYCHPTRPFDPCPDFKENKLPRSRRTDEGEWFTAKYLGGVLGDSFAVVRAMYGKWSAGSWHQSGMLCALAMRGDSKTDLLALQSLSQTRTQQLEALKEQLTQYQPGLRR